MEVAIVILPEVTRKSLNPDHLQAKPVTSAFFGVMKIICLRSLIHHLGFCSEILALMSLEQKYILSYPHSSAAS